jgi:uncharacterized protein
MSLDITPAIPAGRQTIQRYGGGKFVVAGIEYHGPVLVFADLTVEWRVADFTAITAESFAPLMERADTTDILLVGCGTSLLPIPTSLRDGLRAAGLAVEPMDTGAACRTFNVLVGEDRRVAAALIPVD